jgi:type IV pilus assembly protein PilB
MSVDLGEMLLKEKMITPEQLQKALDHQKLGGGSLWAAVVGLGFMRDEDISGLLSRRYGVPSVGLDNIEIDPAVIDVIPAETARKYHVLPLSRVAKALRLAMADPTNLVAIDDISFMTDFKVEPVVASETALEDAIHRYYDSARPLKTRLPGETTGGPTLSANDMAGIGGLSEIDLDSFGDADTAVNAEAVTKLTNVLLVDSLKRGASDIHIEPYEKEFRVRFRIDGVLYNQMVLPMKVRDPLISRVKIMANLDIAEKRAPQYGRIRIKMKAENRSCDLDFRVSVLPTLWGEKIVMRLLDKTSVTLDLTKLGFEPLSLERFKHAISRRSGLVLVTGPRRAGKTTTLYSAVASLNKPDINIMTAEYPVDLVLPGINQVLFRPRPGETFATVLASLGWMDADIILVSEIPDRETAENAIWLAQHGHLVLSTLPTSDAPSTVPHIVNMGLDPFLVGTAVSLIQAQRLVRRICDQCNSDVTAEVPSKVLTEAGVAPDELGTFRVHRGRGCAACHGSGYRGRVGLFEVMDISDGIHDLIVSRATGVEIRKKACDEGMISLRASGLEKVKQGITTIEEVLRETVL